MSAPTGLEILVDEKHVNDLLQQRHGLKAVVRAACNNFCFLFFLFLFTFIALGEPFGDQRAFEGYVRRRFDERAAMPLEEVGSTSSFWKYVNVSLMPAIYGNDTAKYYYPGAQVPTVLPMAGSNLLFGVVRLRMKKVIPAMDCYLSQAYASAFPTCHGPYSEAAENNKGFGPVSPTGDPEFKWLADADGLVYNGKLATYSKGGFMWVLTSNYNESYYRTMFYEEEQWVDASTRIIFIDFTLYNYNLGLYAPCRIIFEVAPSGRWHHTFEVDVFQERYLSALGFGTWMEWMRLVFEGLLLLFIVRYLLEEASEFIGFEHRANAKYITKKPKIKYGYFFDAWNILDWLNLILMVVTMGYRIMTWGVGGKLQVYVGDPSLQDVKTFSQMGGVMIGVAANVRIIRNFYAFNSVLTWFKAVKYINFFPYISTFMQTVAMSQRQLSTFIVVLIIAIVGFVLGFTTAFGEQQQEFRTPWRALLFIMRSFVGNANMEVVYKTAPFLGSLLILIYVVVMVFVVMNLFFAIMISALAEAKKVEDLKSEKKWQQYSERAKDLWEQIYTNWRLEDRFRTCVPGLYSRIMTRKKKREDMEDMREAAWQTKNEYKQHHVESLKDLGPGSPTCGRRKKRKEAQLAIPKEGEESSSDSEADLGPLRGEEQVTRRVLKNDERSPKGGPGKAVGFQLKDKDKDADADSFDSLDSKEGNRPTEMTAEAIDLVIEATRYVADSITTRTEGARQVLFAEMGDAREVLQGIGSVLEVLSRRVGDLQAQQNNLLVNF
jgi:hypothetical protein